jgi:GPH family glycoside/pentoside/hexuronide:cation symporter
VTEQQSNVSSVSASAIGEAGVDHLSTKVIWAYSVPMIAFGIMGMLFATYLMKFATDELLIAPAAMGTLLFLARLWDGVSDPLTGFLSDRTRSRFGRRRSWMLSAAIPCGVGLWMMWSPPLGLSVPELVIWMAIALFVYETASTMFLVPYGALGMELTPNYHERTRLFGYRHMIGAIGTLSGLVCLQLMNMAEDKREFAGQLSMFTSVVVAGLILWAARVLPERRDFQGRASKPLLSAFFDVVRNPHSRLLLIVYGVETFGAASIGLMVPYVVEYVLPMQALMVPILITYIVPQFAFTPLWMALARRFGKKQVWLSAMLLSVVAFGGLFTVTEPGAMVWVWTFLAGFAGGCGAVVAPSIQADVIDYDEYLSGERKEGAYLSVWNLVRKGAGSLTALAAGVALQFAGFEPNIEQSEETKLIMRGLLALLPCICYLIGAVLFMRFAFNEADHARIRKTLAERAAAAD